MTLRIKSEHPTSAPDQCVPQHDDHAHGTTVPFAKEFAARHDAAYRDGTQRRRQRNLVEIDFQ